MSNSFEDLWDRAEAGDGQAQIELGRAYMERQEFGRARRWFGRAARNDAPEAWTELGLLELQGLGQAADPVAARQHFQAASDQGDNKATHQLALMAVRRGEIEPALDLLVAAAEAGYAPALREVGHLLAQRDMAAAVAMWRHAAEAGDVIAQSALALALHRGDGTASDSVGAAHWAAAAVAGGSYCRQRFEPVAVDDERSEVSKQAVTPESVPRPTFEVDFRGTTEHPAGDDRVAVFEAILSPYECEYLMETAAPWLLPSFTVHPHTGEPVRNEMRTSHGCAFHPTQEDFVILAAKQRLAAQTGVPVANAEPFSLLRYETGQEYKPHFDYIDPASGEAGRELGRIGQRNTTVFSYLTDVAVGGETEFPRRDVRVRPRQGRALMFRNVRADGSPDRESLHASLPVQEGEKWIATLWLRDQEYRHERR